MTALELAETLEHESSISEQQQFDAAAMLRKQADCIEQLETALSECRDAMPSPAPGARQEQSWSEALGDPMAVTAYVKETMARLERENAELRKDAALGSWYESLPGFKDSVFYGTQQADAAMQKEQS